jgi:hypothetical protein
LALEVEYVLPLRWDRETSRREAPALTRYLSWLGQLVDVTVIDGSDEIVFRDHHRRWSGCVRHLRPEESPGPNGKVTGVITGVRRSRHECVVVADDDIRYDERALRQLQTTLEGSADVVRPQCVFSETLWHTRWDTGRILLNRALGHDYPGTHGLRRSVFLAAGGYDDRALFENLEMTRTLEAAGARIVDAPWLFVGRRPPSSQQFWHQRVRQAYDDFAQPGRLAVELTLLPALLVTALRAPALLAGWAAAAVALAEVGRRGDDGASVFEPTASLWAPVWALERAICVWLAVLDRLTGGARYSGRRLPLAAHSSRELRRASRAALGPLSLRS